MVKLPDRMRPRGIRYKRFTPGLDLPSWFFYGLKGIDQDLHIVHHPYRVMWDDIINGDAGPIEDTRYTIHEEYGELNFGYVLTDNVGAPLPDGSWHIWRLCEPHGWGHIVQIEDNHNYYLKLMLKRLYLQAKISDKYGHRAYSRHLDQEAEDEAAIMRKDKQALFDAVQEENSWLMQRAMDNFGRGKFAPTNPQKETITSYGGQTHRSRLSRPLDDTEGGLVIPSDWE